MPILYTRPVIRPSINPSEGVFPLRTYKRGISENQAKIPSPNLGKERKRRIPDATDRAKLTGVRTLLSGIIPYEPPPTSRHSKKALKKWFLKGLSTPPPTRRGLRMWYPGHFLKLTCYCLLFTVFLYLLYLYLLYASLISRFDYHLKTIMINNLSNNRNLFNYM